MADEPKVSEKIDNQLAKAKLPIAGAHPFRPRLKKSKKDELIVEKVDTSVAPPERRSSRDRPKLAWGSAAVAEEGDTTVEVDEAFEAWKLSIDMPACYISLQIEGGTDVELLLEFLRRADPKHPLGPFGEFRVPGSSTIWVWDDETSGRLFLWLNKTGKHSIRAELGRQQIECICSALAEATRPS